MPGKYKAYPEYKDSGVEWLADVPTYWDVSTISALSNKITNGYVGPTRDIFRDSGVRYLQSLHIKNNKIDFHTPYYVSEEWSNEKSKSILMLGDVLVVQTGDIGQVAVVKEEIVGCNCHALIIISTTSKLSGFYLSWLLNSDYGLHSLKSIQTGALHPHLNCDTVKSVKVPLPSCNEQEKIVDFLDHETAKIDTLIEKQQQLIKLLKEKRQAVISHAVTKGLNPNAPMRDSGVEWLGEVPEHWVIKNYRYATRIYRGKFGHRPRNDPALYDGKYPFIQTGDIARADKKITAYNQTLNEKGIGVSQKFPAGTLVMAIAANIGDTAILDFEAYAPDSVIGFQPNQDIDLEFLRYSLLAALPALEQTSTQSTQANLNIDRVGTVQASFPPLHEQKTIVKELDRLIERYAAIEIKATGAIELMKERRTALISAAVTGKIDVRNWQPPTRCSQ